MPDLFPPSDNMDSAPEPIRGQLMTATAALEYFLAGKATVTLVSLKTEKRFTYRIAANADRTAYFVNVLTGQDNESDYRYAGRIAVTTAGHRFWPGRRTPRPGDISPDAPSSIAFDWCWRKLVTGAMPDQLQIWHESTCGRCGRKLTVPASVSQGYGPECIGKIGF